MLTAIADAVVKELQEQQQSLALPCEVQRLMDPEQELEDLETFRVDVVPGDKKSEAAGRTGRLGSFRIDIAFRQKLASSTDTEGLDKLMDFAETIEKYFADPPHRLEHYPDAVFVSPAELRYPYLPVHLRTLNQFTSILRLTYKAPI